MFKKSLLTFVLMVAVSQAAVKELIPNLKSDSLQTQTQARLDLLAMCSKAGAPDAPTGSREALCKEMCQILEGNYPVIEVIQPVLNNLERIGGAESVPTLAKLLNHKDPNIRDDARRALVVNPSNEAAQALGAALKSRKMRPPQETAGLIYALGERKQKGASKLIVGALNSPQEDIFVSAVKALGMINEDVGVNALMERHSKESGFRKALVEDALLITQRAEVYETFIAKGQPEQMRAAAMTGMIMAGNASNANAAMASGDAALQLGVIEAGKQGADVYAAISSNIGTLPPHNQVKAIIALETSADRKYGSAVAPLLKSEDGFVKTTAAAALVTLGSADEVPALVNDGGKEARRTLAQLNVDGVDAQLEKLAAPGNEAKQREIAIEALAGRARIDLIPTFFKYGNEEDRMVSGAALKAIGNIGDVSHVEPMVDLMIAKEKSPISRGALLATVQLIRRAGDQAKAVEVLVRKIDGASPRSQANILKVLAETGSPAALAPLAEACRSSDEQLQKTAVKSLGGWKDRNGIDTMMEIAAEESTSLSNHVTLMRGVSRIFASINGWELKREKGNIEKAIGLCRRDEEKAALQATLNKIK